MAQLEILQCAGCGSPLAPDALVCEYCGNKNLIRSKRDPLKITSKIVGDYIAFYTKKTKKNPKDTDSLYAMGLLYLGLKNYELAERNLKEAIDRSPLDADVYYYYALSLLAGRTIQEMGTEQVERIGQYLGTALQMETKCKYLVLLAAVREEYYVQNHLICPGEGPQELFEQAAGYTPDELDEITEHCGLCAGNTLYQIGLLTGEAIEDGQEEQLQEESGGGGLTEEELEAAFNLTEEERRQFYDYRFEPEAPGRGFDLPDGRRLYTKESYVELALRRAWKLFLSLVAFFVLLGICLAAGWGFLSTEPPAEAVSAADSLAVTHIKLISEIKSGKESADILWVERSAAGAVWLLVVLSPLLVWLFVTVRKTLRVKTNRSAAEAHNRQLREEYARAKELYRTKPTTEQMQLFILGYLSRIVDSELEFHGKSEKGLKGKLLFVSEFFDYAEDDENYDESAVEYTIALLEKDCVSVICCDWRVYEDTADTGTIQSIAYADIRDVKLTESQLSFAGITIDIPDEPIFEYQDDDPDEVMGYSITRTSDVRQFAVALRKLHIAHKNTI